MLLKNAQSPRCRWENPSSRILNALRAFFPSRLVLARF